MKRPTLLLAVIVIGSMAVASVAADRTPSLSIEGALKIAQDYLKSASGSEPRSIVGLTLEQSTLRGAPYWYARWSAPISNGAKAELGLRIDMDGSLTKLVSEGGGGASVPGGPSVPVPGVGSQKYGVRNMH